MPPLARRGPTHQKVEEMASKWLLTGGCGFVGANLASALLAEDHELLILDDLSRVGAQSNLEWLREREGVDWRFVEDDVRNAEVISTLVQKFRPDVIAHLAGQVAMTTSLRDPRLDFEINALGTLNVLEAVRLHSPESAVLYSSTNKVYGSLSQLRYEERDTRYVLPDYPYGLDETLPLEGDSPYGCSKLAADQYVRDYQRVYGVPTVVFRHSSMYGGRQYATFDQGWVGWFCQKALEMADPEAPEFTISGDGKQVRDILHADDLVSVYLAAADRIDTAAGEIYNVGGGSENSLSLLELFDQLERLTGNELRYRKLAWRHGDQKVFVADNRKATEQLGWAPSVDRRQGLKRCLQWTAEIIDSVNAAGD